MLLNTSTLPDVAVAPPTPLPPPDAPPTPRRRLVLSARDLRRLPTHAPDGPDAASSPPDGLES